MKDAGGQKVSAQPFPRAIGSHSLSPSLLHPSPLLPIPPRNTPIYLKLSTVSMTRQRVEWFCNSALLQQLLITKYKVTFVHLCDISSERIFKCVLKCPSWTETWWWWWHWRLAGPGRTTRCQTMGPLVSNWPPPSHPSCFRVLSTSIDHPFHFISLLKEYRRTCN